MIGSMGALEAIKILTGVAEPLASQLLICDLKSMLFRKLSIQRNPKCAACCGS
jgi:molybdopterin/thiamine biosynthesis adenylyltransferase